MSTAPGNAAGHIFGVSSTGEQAAFPSLFSESAASQQSWGKKRGAFAWDLLEDLERIWAQPSDRAGSSARGEAQSDDTGPTQSAATQSSPTSDPTLAGSSAFGPSSTAPTSNIQPQQPLYYDPLLQTYGAPTASLLDRVLWTMRSLLLSGRFGLGHKATPIILQRMRSLPPKQAEGGTTAYIPSSAYTPQMRVSRLRSQARLIDSDLRTLLALARSQIDAVPFRDVRQSTLRLYTDACLLLALWQTFRPADVAWDVPTRRGMKRPREKERKGECKVCGEEMGAGPKVKASRRVGGMCFPCDAARARDIEMSEGTLGAVEGDGEDGVAGESVAEGVNDDNPDPQQLAGITPEQPVEDAAPHDTAAQSTMQHDAGTEAKGQAKQRSDPRLPRAYAPNIDASVPTDKWISNGAHGARFIDAVKMLDLALIVAGGGDESRRELIRRVDAELQALISGARSEEMPDYEAFDWPRRKPPPSSRVNSTRCEAGADFEEAVADTSSLRDERAPPAERARSGEGKGDVALTCAHRPIESIPPPSLQTYADVLAGKPFVLRRYASNDEHHPRWPAIERWKSAKYLLSKTGRGRIVPVELGGSYTEAGWGQGIVGWQEFLNRAGWAGALTTAVAVAGATEGSEPKGDRANGNDPVNGEKSSLATQSLDPTTSEGNTEQKAQDRELVPVYLAQHALFLQFPTLETDLSVPDYVHSSPSSDFVPAGIAYAPPPEPLINVWIGSSGVLSPAHTDPYFNCYVQVIGRKRVWIAPPSVTEWMYAFGGGGGNDGDEDDGDDGDGDIGGDDNRDGSVDEGDAGSRLGEGENGRAEEVEDDWVLLGQEGEDDGEDGDDEEDEDDGDDGEDESAFASLMTNTSRLPLLKPGQNVGTILKKYPRFAKVLPHAMETVLEAGDMLVLPPGWWHAMRQEGGGPGWSVSFWY